MEKELHTQTSLVPPNWRAGLVVVGCSTGGPLAIQKILKPLASNLKAPIVIAQHMPKGFTRQFAQRLNKECQLTVVEGGPGMSLIGGTAYVAPAGYLTRIGRTATGSLMLDVVEADAKEWLYRPSVDELFRSAASVVGKSVLAVVMTGMGNDGVKGAKTVKENGGYVITESSDTAVIYGMPRAVFEAGHSDVQVPVTDISKYILRYT